MAFWEIQRQRCTHKNAKYDDIKAFNEFRWKKRNLKGFLKVLLKRSIFPAKILEICHGRYGLVSQKCIQDAKLSTLQVNVLILSSVFPFTVTRGKPLQSWHDRNCTVRLNNTGVYLLEMWRHRDPHTLGSIHLVLQILFFGEASKQENMISHSI